MSAKRYFQDNKEVQDERPIKRRLTVSLNPVAEAVTAVASTASTAASIGTSIVSSVVSIPVDVKDVKSDSKFQGPAHNEQKSSILDRLPKVLSKMVASYSDVPCDVLTNNGMNCANALNYSNQDPKNPIIRGCVPYCAVNCSTWVNRLLYDYPSKAYLELHNPDKTAPVWNIYPNGKPFPMHHLTLDVQALTIHIRNSSNSSLETFTTNVTYHTFITKIKGLPMEWYFSSNGLNGVNGNRRSKLSVIANPAEKLCSILKRPYPQIVTVQILLAADYKYDFTKFDIQLQKFVTGGGWDKPEFEKKIFRPPNKWRVLPNHSDGRPIAVLDVVWNPTSYAMA